MHFEHLDQMIEEELSALLASEIDFQLKLEQLKQDIWKLEAFSVKRVFKAVDQLNNKFVDEQALRTALETGLIAGAGFDVLTKEPPKEGNPLLDLRMPNFILTPHVAWASDGAMQFLADWSDLFVFDLLPKGIDGVTLAEMGFFVDHPEGFGIAIFVLQPLVDR